MADWRRRPARPRRRQRWERPRSRYPRTGQRSRYRGQPPTATLDSVMPKIALGASVLCLALTACTLGLNIAAGTQDHPSFPTLYPTIKATIYPSGTLPVTSQAFDSHAAERAIPPSLRPRANMATVDVEIK